jgi:putative autoinducer-2 (AI-2) aldolase
MAGGKKLNEDEALTMVYKAMHEGARGVDMGRNIFQSLSPVAMVKAIRKVVHEGFSDTEAYSFFIEEKAKLEKES